MHEVAVSGHVRARPEHDQQHQGPVGITHTTHVARPTSAQQLGSWSIADVVLRLQLRNPRRELEC